MQRKLRAPFLLAVAAWVAATAASSQILDPACRSVETLAERLLEEDDTGTLPVGASLQLDPELLDAGRLRARLVAQLALPAGGVDGKDLCVAIIVDAGGELVVVHGKRLATGSLTGAEAWTYGLELDLSEDAGQILVVLSEVGRAIWGAALAEEREEALPTGGPAAVRLADGAWTEIERPRATASRTASGTRQATLVRLVPPRDQPVAGNTTFDLLVSSPSVERVVYYLDDAEVATRGRRSLGALTGRAFAARLDLAKPAREQTVRVVAYGSGDLILGEDTLIVNRVDAPFRARILELRRDLAAGEIEIAATVSVPSAARLDHVELYHNEELVGRFAEASFRQRLALPDPGPDDYLRVAAFLADGTSIDDVVLIAAPGAVEQVDVNLVELHVVVTDDAGQAVGDLQPEVFTVSFAGRSQPIQSFAYADDVPLLVGLVVDTSGSMILVMEDTRRAAAKFLGTTVLPQDQAFVVDFDQRPRLRQATTGDMPTLLQSLATLQAEGTTALYDAIVFSMLQFERQKGRKALVVLSDGDDRDSRYGPKSCIEFGQTLGVPTYIIGLGALDDFRRTYPKKELRRVTEQTGGRLYFVDSLEELDAAYAQIQAELRSQYSLTFYADRDLSDAERRDVEVQLSRPNLSARVVVGNRVSED